MRPRAFRVARASSRASKRAFSLDTFASRAPSAQDVSGAARLSLSRVAVAANAANADSNDRSPGGVFARTFETRFHSRLIDAGVMVTKISPACEETKPKPTSRSCVTRARRDARRSSDKQSAKENVAEPRTVGGDRDRVGGFFERVFVGGVRRYVPRSISARSTEDVGDPSGEPEWLLDSRLERGFETSSAFSSEKRRLARFFFLATTTRSVLSRVPSQKRRSDGNANTGALCLESSRLARSRKCVRSAPLFAPSGKHSATPTATQRAGTRRSRLLLSRAFGASSSSPSSSDALFRSSPRRWNRVTSSGSFASSAAVTARVSSILTRLIASSTTPASVPSITPPLYRNRTPRASFAAATARSLSLDATATPIAGSSRLSTESRGPESTPGALNTSAASSCGVAKHAPIRLPVAPRWPKREKRDVNSWKFEGKIGVSRHNRVVVVSRVAFRFVTRPTRPRRTRRLSWWR